MLGDGELSFLRALSSPTGLRDRAFHAIGWMCSTYITALREEIAGTQPSGPTTTAAQLTDRQIDRRTDKER